MNAEEDNIKKLIILKCTSCEEMTWERTNNYRESHRIYLFIPSTKTKPPKNEPTKRDKSSPQPCLGRPRPRQDRLRFVDEPAKRTTATNIEQKKCMWNMKPNASDGRLFFLLCNLPIGSLSAFLLFTISTLPGQEKKPKLWGRAI